MILNLLIPKEKIIGLEINSQKLRMLFLELDKNNIAIAKGKSEIELEEGTFSPEGILDENKLNKAINDLKNNFKPNKFFSPFIIVTIPQNSVYSEILEFSTTLDEEQLAEAITLNASENLPLPLSKCYIDWQIIESTEQKNKILVSTIARNIVDSYTKILEQNGFKLIALETSFLSIQRAVQIPKEPTIFLYLTNEGITSIIYKNEYPYFNQFELWKEIVPGKEIKNLKDLNKVIKDKINKLKLYFESHSKGLEINNILLLSYGFDADIIINKIKLVELKIKKAKIKIESIDNSDWVPVAGAAARAFIPRSEDTIISLLSTGTESLYETQKAVSFARSILLLLSTLSIFYISIFIGTYSLVAYLQNNIDNQIEKRNDYPVSREYAKIKSETEEFNSYLKDLEMLYSTTEPNYTDVLKNISKINTPGINITILNFNKKSKLIHLSGIAANRSSVNVFKSKIENPELFKKSDFSVKNIAQKENIAFDANLYIK
ncbi:MAG: pilus assembly protein PilM [Patescibacteria group bacterium]|nr:pilus assembly protein PilM [Patescibacteria group bacterium]